MKTNLARKALLGMLSATILLSACQQGNPEGSSAPSASASAPSPPSVPSASAAESEGSNAIANFNPTGYPICPDEPVTLRVLVSVRAELPSDLNTLPVQAKMEEVTNVHVDWVTVPGTGYEEKKNLMLATGDLPDLIESSVSTSDLLRYGADGTFIPMQDLIRDYAPNFNAIMDEMPELRPFITAPDGNIYGFARVNCGPWMPTNGVGVINQMWLDNLGLAMPTNIDEFYEVLKAFKTRDPNGNGMADEIPMTFCARSASALTDHNGLGYLMSSFGFAINGVALNESYADVQDGKVICIGTLPEYKEAVAYISKLYTEGLIDIEGFTLKQPDLVAKLNQEPGIIGYTQLWDINDSVSNPTNNEAFVYMPLLKGPDGRKPVFYRQPLPGTYRGYGVITKACEHPEIATRWLDYLYDETNAIEVVEGPIGERVLEDTDGTLYVRNPPEGMTISEDRFSFTKANLFGLTERSYRERLKLHSTDDKVAFIDSFMDEFSDPDPFPPVYYTADEANEIVQLQLDIEQYIERKTSEWIMNGTIDAQWDAYLAEIENVGLPRWLEIKQAAYERYMAEN